MGNTQRTTTPFT